MSWGIYTVGLAPDIAGRIDALQPAHDAGEESASERDAQLVAAKAVAKELIASGAVGTGEAFHVSLSGHATPEHKPTAQGWAGVQVAVTQRDVAAVTEFDATSAA